MQEHQWTQSDLMAIAVASGFALAAHAGQKRKYTGIDYYNHPKAVSEILYEHGVRDIEMILAALLHDTVEDTHITIQQIYDYFGGDVAMMVEWLTKTEWPDPQPNRTQKKLFEAGRLKMAPANVKTIKLADRLHNTPDIIANEPSFAPVFVAETRHLLDTALVGGDPVLWAKVDAIVRDYQKQHA